jgi:hypothetical protein
MNEGIADDRDRRGNVSGQQNEQSHGTPPDATPLLQSLLYVHMLTK